MESSCGILYICSTPIGNLEDITLRCLRILKEVDYIAAEDTRVTKKLLTHYQIETPLISYHKYSEKEKSGWIIEKIQEGKSIALVTDSGTPVISDPGNIVAEEAIKNNIRVVPIPGPSAITGAISASGLVSEGFVFYGFLPKPAEKKAKMLKSLTSLNLPVVIYESPQRVLATLECIQKTLGDINIVVARELTKIYEEISTKKVSEHIEHFNSSKPRGEFTIIIEKILANNESVSEEELNEIIRSRLASNESVSSIADEVSQNLNFPRNYIYKLVLALSRD